MSLVNDNSGLLERTDFREGVFKRDGYKCVICGGKNELDAHHILERRQRRVDQRSVHLAT